MEETRGNTKALLHYVKATVEFDAAVFMGCKVVTSSPV